MTPEAWLLVFLAVTLVFEFEVLFWVGIWYAVAYLAASGPFLTI